MLVSVVSAVTGNSLLRYAIESVQNQTYSRIEHLIVIDGQEREASVRQILASMDLSRHRTHILCLPYPTGKDNYICHRIYGMAPFLINGEYVCYLDEDNWYDPNHVESLVRIVEEKNLDWAYALRKIVDRDGNFLCLDDCESLGKWACRENYHMVDTNCYFLKKEIAIEFSQIWYAKFREVTKVTGNTYVDNPDIALCKILLEKYQRVDTTGIYSVNYRLGSSSSSVQLSFFWENNQRKQEQYPYGFPWRRIKLKDIPLPRSLPKQASADCYKEEFFHEVKTAAHSSASAVLPYLWQLLDHRVQSVVDVGCGTGSWLAKVQSLFGITDILGIDGDYVERDRLEIPVDKFLSHDLIEPLPIQRRFDLVICLEVAEHLPYTCAATFIQTLTELGDVILFSAAIPLQPGTNHINTQFPHYWLQLFQERGYKCIDCLRDKFWQDSRVEWWYAQNMLLFVKENILTENTNLLALHQMTDLNCLVRIHPRNLPAKIAFGHDDTVELKVETSAIGTDDEKYKLHRELLLKFFDKSPYEDFPYLDYSCDLQGWGSTVTVFERLISQLLPKLIIEVGTWKGASAIHMVDILKSHGIVCPVLCVDTWLGGLEVAKDNPISYLGVTVPRRYGYSQLYFQFLANVMHRQAQNYIVPIPLHAVAAFKLLLYWRVSADLIYVDASHEEEDVYADLSNYWQLLRSGGVLLGDDYPDPRFPGVYAAVNRFAKENNLEIQSEGNKFWFKKPVSAEDKIEALTKRIAELELKLNPDIDLSYFA
ncbi:MAG: class I SAM-dependent methyltransferase [Pseudanabaenaceae cyanobacterium SKYGB_i_bin29]|nr:class I SAM-dependent methyltransferase [Pseudanabaenaceae cyanobacterium SKYG29]MDW8420804.1 class I SAM-dependent methyltransferase [Pseudanabaenaceae cyanobacterium SKYGB_i_bin29]